MQLWLMIWFDQMVQVETTEYLKKHNLILHLSRELLSTAKMWDGDLHKNGKPLSLWIKLVLLYGMWL